MTEENIKPCIGYDPETQARLAEFNEWRKTQPAADVSDPIANLAAAYKYGQNRSAR